MGDEVDTNWEEQARFWQMKYFELLIHSQQVITALNQPMLEAIKAAKLAQAAQ